MMVMMMMMVMVMMMMMMMFTVLDSVTDYNFNDVYNEDVLANDDGDDDHDNNDSFGQEPVHQSLI